MENFNAIENTTFTHCIGANLAIELNRNEVPSILNGDFKVKKRATRNPKTEVMNKRLKVHAKACNSVP